MIRAARHLTALLILLTSLTSGALHAAIPESTLLKFAGDNDEKIAALAEIAATNDPAGLPILQAFSEDRLKVQGGKRVLVQMEDHVLDAVTGEKLAKLPDDAEDVSANNRVRGAIEGALAAYKLADPDRTIRIEAVRTLKSAASEALLPLLERAAGAEKDAEIASLLRTTLATVQLQSPDAAKRITAVKVLGESSDTEMRQLLGAMLEKDGDTFKEPDAAVRAEVASAIKAINARLKFGEYAGLVFTGMSLGSILLLAALGLAITYGLMGVINMAHGELIMIGAYAAYVTQNLVRAHAPELFEYYPLFAIPVSFMAAAIVGVLMERLVIRFLYGRPLETLLATWGISLMLIQLVRSVFGAQNVPVENPQWLSGGVVAMSNLTLPWNRIAILVFAALVVIGMALIITKTRLGLFVRAVTQNRQMASCVGVRTPMVDTLAFGLGSGIAGLAGCALAQVGNVGPDLGQGYIIDSFMVVVLGGVGQLAGTIYAALGLGIISKFLEGFAGAVLAKIAVLVIIIIFIQKRPQGLFAVRGRFVEN